MSVYMCVNEMISKVLVDFSKEKLIDFSLWVLACSTFIKLSLLHWISSLLVCAPLYSTDTFTYTTTAKLVAQKENRVSQA